jgi:hypothetical protein
MERPAQLRGCVLPSVATASLLEAAATGQLCLARVFFHFPYGAKNQKLLLALHSCPAHEYKTPNSFSRARDFVFLPALKYSLPVCHFSSLVFVPKKQKAQ